MTIGNRVLQLLTEKGLKQKDLADYLKTGASTINGWKSSNRNPSSDMIIPICEFLSVDVHFLLTGVSNSTQTSLNKEDMELITLLHKLPPAKRYEFKGELKGYIRRMEEDTVAAESSSDKVTKKSLA